MQIDHHSLFLRNTPESPSIMVGIIIDSWGMCRALLLTHTRNPTMLNFCSHSTHCNFSNQRLSCSTVHYQMSWKNFRESMRIPMVCCCSENISFPSRRSLGVPSPSIGFGDRRNDCLICPETFLLHVMRKIHDPFEPPS